MTRVELSRAAWRKSSRSPANGGTEDCVEVTALEGGWIAVRDSKQPDGTVLLFTRTQMVSWVSGVKADDFGDLA